MLLSPCILPWYDWIVDPDAQVVEILAWEAGEYSSLGVFHGEETLPSQVVLGFDVQVKKFFA